MASAPAPSHRASLLSGLRTGGVRSASMAGVPYTAAPGASFNIPSRFASNAYNQQSISEEDDQLSDMLSHNMYINTQQGLYQPPNTAAVDGGANRFAYQQGHFTNGLMSHPNAAVNNAQLQVHAQQQALQMQLMQLGLIRMQVRSLPPPPLLVYLISSSGSASPAIAGRVTCPEPPAEWSIVYGSCHCRSRNTVIRFKSGPSQLP